MSSAKKYGGGGGCGRGAHNLDKPVRAQFLQALGLVLDKGMHFRLQGPPAPGMIV